MQKIHPIFHILITVLQNYWIKWTVILMTGQNYCKDQAFLTQSIHSHSQVSFNPQDNTQICVSGNGVFKIFRYAGETLKQSSTFKTDAHFLCHTWISTEKVVAGTETGQLMMFESSRLRWEINVASVRKVKRWGHVLMTSAVLGHFSSLITLTCNNYREILLHLITHSLFFLPNTKYT